MNTLVILQPLVDTLTWLIPAVLLIGILKTPWFKGWFGERLVRVVAHYQLDRQVYRRLHDVTLPTPDGTTQIDHVFLSPYGIFTRSSPLSAAVLSKPMPVNVTQSNRLYQVISATANQRECAKTQDQIASTI